MILNHRETKLMPRREWEQSGTGIYHIMLRLTQHYIRYGKRCDSRVGSKTCPHDPRVGSKTEVNPESWTQLKGSNEKGI